MKYVSWKMILKVLSVFVVCVSLLSSIEPVREIFYNFSTGSLFYDRKDIFHSKFNIVAVLDNTIATSDNDDLDISFWSRFPIKVAANLIRNPETRREGLRLLFYEAKNYDEMWLLYRASRYSDLNISYYAARNIMNHIYEKEDKDAMCIINFDLMLDTGNFIELSECLKDIKFENLYLLAPFLNLFPEKYMEDYKYIFNEFLNKCSNNFGAGFDYCDFEWERIFLQRIMENDRGLYSQKTQDLIRKIESKISTARQPDSKVPGMLYPLFSWPGSDGRIEALNLLKENEAQYQEDAKIVYELCVEFGMSNDQVCVPFMQAVDLCFQRSVKWLSTRDSHALLSEGRRLSNILSENPADLSANRDIIIIKNVMKLWGDVDHIHNNDRFPRNGGKSYFSGDDFSICVAENNRPRDLSLFPDFEKFLGDMELEEVRRTKDAGLVNYVRLLVERADSKLENGDLQSALGIYRQAEYFAEKALLMVERVTISERVSYIYYKLNSEDNYVKEIIKLAETAREWGNLRKEVNTYLQARTDFITVPIFDRNSRLGGNSILSTSSNDLLKEWHERAINASTRAGSIYYEIISRIRYVGHLCKYNREDEAIHQLILIEQALSKIDNSNAFGHIRGKKKCQ